MTNDEQETYDEWVESLPGGWINSIDDDSVIIDDTVYYFGEDTSFETDRSELEAGVFVKYERRKGFFLTIIMEAEPTEDDMDMKPIVRSSDSGEGSSTTPTQGNEPTLENGVWVN